ncbi:MAG: hypothetical protein E7031_03285 [Akkermansiaceae bacterium]|nr:hypothetical protein [Akkermansiaceae bacterium]
MIKKLIPIILLAGSSLGQTQPEVSVQLYSCRTEYRTHDETDKPGFGVKLELLPIAGVNISATETLSTTVTLSDESGKKHTPTTAAILTDAGKTFAKFTFKNRPEGKRVKLEGEIKLDIAKNVTVHNNINPNLLQAHNLHIGEASFEIIPSSANAANSNREGDRLKRAELQLRYPASVTITQIARQWAADTDTPFAQEIDFTTTISDDQSTKTTTLVLLDVLPSPTLIITTCTEKSKIAVPVGFNITLSSAESINIEPENQ